jgi:phosphoribosylpyrophosphate synthetase
MLLSLDGASALAQGVAERLGEPLAPVEHRPFHDGEHKWRPLEDPRGCDVFVLASLTLFSNALRTEATYVLAGTPEVILQRMVAGRHDLVPPG